MSTSKNKKIESLHKRLIRTVGKLAKRLAKTSDPAEAEAILREMEEVNFRVMMAGRLLFKETTDAIDRRVDDVIAGAGEVDEAIEELETAKKVIRAVGKFLTAVDKVLDAAKAAGKALA